jgi:hypothetical protein
VYMNSIITFAICDVLSPVKTRESSTGKDRDHSSSLTQPVYLWQKLCQVPEGRGPPELFEE